MTGLTVTQAQQQLDGWLKANLAVAQGRQSYTIATGSSSRTLTRANAAEILKQIQFYPAIPKAEKSPILLASTPISFLSVPQDRSSRAGEYVSLAKDKRTE